MSYPVIESVSTKTLTTAAASITVDKPSDTVNDNLLLAVITGRLHTDNDLNENPQPSGWKVISYGKGGGFAHSISLLAYKKASSEPSDYEFTFPGNVVAAGKIFCISGYDPDNIIADSSDFYRTDHDATDCVATAITANANNLLFFVACGARDHATIVPSIAVPSGMDDQGQIMSTLFDSWNDIRHVQRVASEGVSAGDTGTRTGVNSDAQYWNAHLIAINPAPAVGYPTLVSSATNTAGTIITLTFSKAMADPAGKHGEFSFKVGITARTFSAAALDGTKINLTVSGDAIAYGNVVTVSYVKGTIVAGDDTELQSFTDRSVTNAVPAPDKINIQTNALGVATVDLPDGEYSYKATKAGRDSVVGPFTVAGAIKTIDISMGVIDDRNPFTINNALASGFKTYGLLGTGNDPDADWIGTGGRFDIMVDAGFTNVGINVQWHSNDSNTAPDYTINAAYLERVGVVVDAALSKGLGVILSTHHGFHNTGNTERWMKHLEQTAAYFAGRAPNLVMELINEPDNNRSASEWNSLIAEAVSRMRVHAPTRLISVSGRWWSGIDGISELVLPDDDYLLLTIHYYHPWEFTHSCTGWSDTTGEWCGTGWWNMDALMDQVKRHFQIVTDFATANNVPVRIGEFGVYESVTQENRLRYIEWIAKYAESLGWSWSLWDFHVDFGVYDDGVGWQAGALDALINTPRTVPASLDYSTSVIYESNFATNTDGWVLNLKNNGQGSLYVSGGELMVVISNGGTSLDAVEIGRNVAVVHGAIYEIELTVRPESARGIYTILPHRGMYYNISSQFEIIEGVALRWDRTNWNFRIHLGGSAVNLNIVKLKITRHTLT